MKKFFLQPELSLLIFDGEEDILTDSSTGSTDSEKHAVQNSEETVSSSVTVSMKNILSLDN